MFYLIDVAPIKKGLILDSVSYISAKSFKKGDFIKVPLRNKQEIAIVINSSPISEEKSFIKKSDFQFKLLKSRQEKNIIFQSAVDSILELQEKFPVPYPKLFYEFIPQAVLEHNFELKKQKTFDERQDFMLQQTTDNRVEVYKTIIRENLAQKNSVFILAPTIDSAEQIYSQIQKGISKYAFVLHSKLTKKQILKTWEFIIYSNKPVAIVGTKGFLFVPRYDIKTFIIEQDANFSYSGFESVADIRILLEIYAKKINADIVFADLVVSLNSAKKLKEHKITIMEDSINTLRNSSKIKIIDMGEKARSGRSKEQEFIIFDKKELQLLQKNKVLILSGRSGISSTTVCLDCGNLLRCSKCGGVMNLFGKSSQRFFICKRCGHKKDAKTLCNYCGSWRLKDYGIGVEKIHQELIKQLDNKTIYTLDSFSSYKQAKNTVNSFLSDNAKSILISTPKVLNLINTKAQIPLCIVPSFEQFLSIPTFKAEEQLFRHLMLLREKCKRVVIQTRLPQHYLLDYVATGKISDYLSDELNLRKKIKYPPYYIFVTVTFAGKKQSILTQVNKFINDMSEYNFKIFQEMIPIKTDIYYISVIFRFKDFIPEEFIEYVKQLHLKAKITVEI